MGSNCHPLLPGAMRNTKQLHSLSIIYLVVLILGILDAYHLYLCITYQAGYLDFFLDFAFRMMKIKGNKSHQSSFLRCPDPCPPFDCRNREIGDLGIKRHAKRAKKSKNPRFYPKLDFLSYFVYCIGNFTAFYVPYSGRC